MKNSIERENFIVEFQKKKERKQNPIEKLINLSGE